jgi:hypothetical protein
MISGMAERFRSTAEPRSRAHNTQAIPAYQAAFREQIATLRGTPDYPNSYLT